MKKYTTYVVISALAFTLVASPIAGFAKEKEAKENKRNEQKSEFSVSVKSKATLEEKKAEKEERGSDKSKCFRAFGHLIAPGWLKKNSAPEFDTTNCWLPFGIAKKLQGNNASSTSDTDVKAPVISGIAVLVGSSTTTITWVTNEPATSKVFYGTSTPLNIASSSTMSSGTTTLSTSHSVTLSGLATSTVHFFKVQSTDASANVRTSSQFTATTSAGL